MRGLIQLAILLIFAALTSPLSTFAAEPEAKDAATGIRSEWLKTCPMNAETKSNEICRTFHERLDGKTGDIIVSATVTRIDGAPTKRLLVDISTTVVSPIRELGAQIRVDDYAPLRVKIKNCTKSTCRIETELTRKLMYQMRNGKQMVVAVINPKHKAMGFPVPLTAFAETYDGAPYDEAKWQEKRREAIESIKKKAGTGAD